MSEWGRPESQGERVEIELTPVEPRHQRPLVAGSTPIHQPPHESGSEPSEPAAHGGETEYHVPRRTLIATALAVGVAALATGWVVGRSDDGTTGEPTSPATTVTATTTTEHFDTIAPPVTTARPRPSTTTTTTVAAGTPVDINLPLALRVLPYELAFSTYEGELQRIDFAAGTMRTYRGRRGGESFVAFSTTGDLIVYTPWDASALGIIALDGSQAPLASADVDPSRSLPVVIDGKGAVWVVTADGTAATVTGTGVDTASEVVQMPEGIIERGGAIGDPAGGLLASISGDVFDINASGSTRLTTGEMVALGADTAIVSECDAAMVCGHFLIDRATGGRRPYPLQDVIQQAAPPLAQVTPGTRVIIQYGAYWPTQASIAGNTAVVGTMTTNGTTSFREGIAIIDVAREQVVGVLADTYGPVALSDDGSWVFAGNGLGIVAFEVSTGNTFRFGPDANEGFSSMALWTE